MPEESFPRPLDIRVIITLVRGCMTHMKKKRLIITAMSLSLMLLCACGDDPDRDAIPTAATTATTTEATTEEATASDTDTESDTTEAMPQVAEDFELIPGVVENYTREDDAAGSHYYYDGYFVSKCFKYLYSPIGAYSFRYFVETSETTTTTLDRNNPEALVEELKKPAVEDTTPVEFRDFAMSAISAERSGFQIDVAASVSYIPKADQIKPQADTEKEAADKRLAIAKGIYGSAELTTEEISFMDKPVTLYLVEAKDQNVTGFVFIRKGEYLCRISVSVSSGYKTDAEGNTYVPDIQKALPLIKTELNGFEAL